jgi:hypothetical protein
MNTKQRNDTKRKAAKPNGETTGGNSDPDVNRFERMMVVVERIADAVVVIAGAAEAVMVSQGKIENLNARGMAMAETLMRATGVDGIVLANELDRLGKIGKICRDREPRDPRRVPRSRCGNF